MAADDSPAVVLEASVELEANEESKVESEEPSSIVQEGSAFEQEESKDQVAPV